MSYPRPPWNEFAKAWRVIVQESGPTNIQLSLPVRAASINEQAEQCISTGTEGVQGMEKQVVTRMICENCGFGNEIPKEALLVKEDSQWPMAVTFLGMMTLLGFLAWVIVMATT